MSPAPARDGAGPELRSRRWRAAAVVAGITLLWGIVAGLLLDPHAVGLFHDDGLYVLGGQSIARGQGYKIASLPGEPAQTKYPFLLSALLAGIWKLFPEFPANARWLQGVGLLSGALLIPLTFRFARRNLGLDTQLAIGSALLVASSPVLFGVTGWVLTELPFAVVALAALLLVEPSTDAAEAPVWRWALAGGLAAAGYLLKSQGVVLGVALVAAALSHRQWRRACALVAGFAPGPIAWWLFRATHASEPGSWLLRYYVTYDYFLPHWTGEGFATLRAILPENLAETSRALFYLSPAGGLEPGAWGGAWVAVGLAGALVLACYRGARATALFFVLMIGSTVVVPWAPLRFLVPLLPLVVALLVLLASVGAQRLAAAGSAGEALARRRSRALAAGLIGVALVANAVDLGGQLASLRAESLPNYPELQDVRKGWRGFAETIAWIRLHTAKEDLVASVIDPFYYLHTGRRGVRYWRFNSPTYFYPDRRRARAAIGSADEVVPELRRLGVRWLLREPVLEDFFAEGRAADTLAQEIVASDGVRATLVFRSSDFGHLLYRLDWPADGIPAAEQGASSSPPTSVSALPPGTARADVPAAEARVAGTVDQ